jgi:hypothetical protein
MPVTKDSRGEIEHKVTAARVTQVNAYIKKLLRPDRKETREEADRLVALVREMGSNTDSWAALCPDRQRAWSWFDDDPVFTTCPLSQRVICKYDGTTWHASHVLAKAQDGSNERSNLRPLSGAINLDMGEMHMYPYVRENYGSDEVKSLHLDHPLTHNHGRNVKRTG